MLLRSKEKVHFTIGRSARKELQSGEATVISLAKLGRIPRVSKLMALAIRLLHQLETGELENQAQVARLGRVTRARLSQIMSLNHLAPDIQEHILCLPRLLRGGDPIQMLHLLPLSRESDWSKQRGLWNELDASQASRFPSECGKRAGVDSVS